MVVLESIRQFENQIRFGGAALSSEAESPKRIGDFEFGLRSKVSFGFTSEIRIPKSEILQETP